MIKKQNFKVNQKIEIAMTGEDMFYSTLIHDITGRILYVVMPTLKGLPFIPPQGTKMEGRFFEGDAMYLFNTVALGIKTGDRVPLLMLERPLRLERKQRRDYYRRFTLCDMDYSYVGGEEDFLEKRLSSPPQETPEWFAAKTLDVGGGGIRFASTTKIAPETKIHIKIYIGLTKDQERDVVMALGQIVRVERAPGSSQYIYSVRFLEITENQRDRIINYIFNLSRNRYL